jgi:hypothetical protein
MHTTNTSLESKNENDDVIDKHNWFIVLEI